jgi:hypothetical protein
MVPLTVHSVKGVSGFSLKEGFSAPAKKDEQEE